MNKGLEALDKLVNHINLLTHINGVEQQQEAFEPLVNKNKSIIEKELKRLEELEKAFVALSKEDEKAKKLLSKEIEKNRALEIIKVLFQGRAKLYERNDSIEKTIDKNGNYRKCNCIVYILEFYSGCIHYEFHLHKDEYDLLKEVLL